jgi:hypothetical protein
MIIYYRLAYVAFHEHNTGFSLNETIQWQGHSTNALRYYEVQGLPRGIDYDYLEFNILEVTTTPQDLSLQGTVTTETGFVHTYPIWTQASVPDNFPTGGGGGGGGGDQSGDTNTTGQVSPGGSADGNIDPAGDRDWFGVQLAAGTTYLIDLEGSPSNAGTLGDPYLRLYNGAGNLIVEDDDSGDGLNSRLAFTPSTTGTYFIGAGEFGDNATGTYRVSVSGGTGGAPDLTAWMRGLDQTSVPRGGNITYHFSYLNQGSVSASVNTFALYVSSDATITTSDTLLTFADLGAVEAGSRLDIVGSGPLLESIGPGNYYIGVIADYLGQVGESNEGNNVSSGLPFTVTGTNNSAVPNDFDADGDSDILWRHNQGPIVTWEMEDGNSLGNRNHGSVANQWRISATGDFDGDGDADILWRHTDGPVVTWEMENGQYVVNHNIAFASTGWEIVDTGDFDADGDSDVLWRHQQGAVVTWEMENGAYIQNHNIAFASTGWRIDGLGDFDGDGDADIIWRHQQGAVVTWEMEDGAYVTNHNIASASTGWRIEDTGDFDGDGDDDIMWRHQQGAVVTWEMANGAFVTSHSIASASNNWRIEQAGDFDRDGDSDVLWRHDDGTVVTWEMDAGALLQSHGLAAVSNSWQIA